MASYLSPKLDVVVKMIFERNVALLGDFLLSVLDISEKDIEKITVLNPSASLDYPEEKKSIMDIKVELKNGRRVNVELQVRKVPEMIQRLHYYKARMVTEQLSSGNPYGNIVPTSCVALLDYTMYEDQFCHHTFRYYDKKHDVEFSAYEEINIVEIPKLKQETSNHALRCWLEFFNATEQEEFDMLSNQSEVMKNVVGVLANLSADEKARMIADAREKELRDQMSRERGAREEGKLEVARNLFKMGFPIIDIAKATELPVSTIETLLQ